MKNSQLILIILAIISLSFSACKTEPIDEVEQVKNKFIGRWPLKVRILDTLKNGEQIDPKPDTITLPTIDTLVFTADNKLTLGGTMVNYSFDNSYENVTYATTPPVTWHIDFLRINSIILSNVRTETVGNDTFKYRTEEQLIK